MIKVTVNNATQAIEVINAFENTTAVLNIVIKENTVGQDDVKEIISLNNKLMIENIKFLKKCKLVSLIC